MTRAAAFLLLLAGLLGRAPSAAAQFFPFGANKVQYRKLDWQVARGPHVDLYYYPAEAGLLPMALAAAEAGYDTLALRFGHEVPTRIPLILYASHRDFEQTNVLPFRPPEGILGATDFLKRRVVMPYRGSVGEFLGTLRHELVHVFQLSIGSESFHKGARSVAASFPLWWTEGLAEYWSAGEDARDEMILRDLVLGGRLPRLQDLSPFGSGLEYSLGGRVMRWLGTTYGDWRIAAMQRDLWTFDSFDQALRYIYGKSLEELDREFALAIKREYFPVAMERKPLPLLGRQVASRAIEPVLVPDAEDGGTLYYVSQARGYVTIYRRRLDGRPQELVVSGRSPEFESLHPFESRFDTSREGLLLFASQREDRDALMILDISRRRIVGRYSFPELAGIRSPAWAPDGTILLSGLGEDGVSDLYRVHLPEGRLERLTTDHYQDLDPSPSPDGTRVAFASDRTAGGDAGAMNLFLLDLATGRIRQLTAGAWLDESPVWGRDDRIWFTSSRDGVLNAFSVDTLGRGRRETASWTGVLDVHPVPGREAVTASGFDEFTLNAWLLPLDTAARRDTFALADPAPHGAWQLPGLAETGTEALAGEPYRKRLTVDFLAGEGAVVPGYGGGAAFGMLMSDLLGDHLAALSVFSWQGEELGSFFENLSASAVYLNQARRVNWAAGAFRFSTRNFEGERVVAYEEKTVGALGQLRFPLNRFERLEGSMVVEHSDRTDFTLPVDQPNRKGLIVSHFLAYVRDNSLWTSAGPIDGTRLSLTGGIGNDFTNARFDNWLLRADVRHYFRLGLRSAYAVRAFGFASGGDRPRRTNIGGSLGLRGYPFYGYIVGTKAWMLNQELRFPLFRHVTFGTAVGDVRLPENQAAIFVDLGQAGLPYESNRAVLGSFGLGFRWPLGPLAVIRLDLGWRFSSDQYRGYALSTEDKRPFFLSLFFGYNY
jgi:hypothetical protein